MLDLKNGYVGTEIGKRCESERERIFTFESSVWSSTQTCSVVTHKMLKLALMAA